MTRLFVGFNFCDDGLLSKKIVGFRKRFDPKYNHYSFAHMSMLAPFDIIESEIDNLSETLKEELETFFYENTESPNLAFSGVGVHQYNRKHMLYLNPIYSTDLNYCSEVVLDVCKSFLLNKAQYKENKKQFLPLGEFKGFHELQTVMDHAKIEFENNSELPIQSISLYQKRFGVWFERDVLVRFDEVSNQYLDMAQVTV